MQPRPQVSPLLELVESRVRLGKRFLNEVLSVTGVLRHPQGSGVELAHERHHVLLESHVTVRHLRCLLHWLLRSAGVKLTLL